MDQDRAITVVAVDRHELLMDCLAVALESGRCRFEKVSMADESISTRQALTRVLRVRPTMAVVNTHLGAHCSATALIAALARARIPIVALADSTDEAHWGLCLQLGAQVVVPKSAPLAAIVAITRQLAEGDTVIAAEERDRLLGLHSGRSPQERHGLARLDRLSTQEKHVLGHLMCGQSPREIAAHRVVSEATVRTQVKSVLRKLEVSSQLSAVALAHLARWEPYADPDVT